MMKYRKVTAIIPQSTLQQVEIELAAMGVPGMTVTKVHGMGEYRNYYTQDTMSDCSRIEIFTDADNAKEIARAIVQVVGQGMSTDGIIAILPVEEWFHIKDYSEE